MSTILPANSKSGINGTLHIDMTPMVDLGFLLISFFIFTSSLSAPRSLKLIMPQTKPPYMQVKESNLLTIVLGDLNNVLYYEGKFENANRRSIFKARIGDPDLRNQIMLKKKEKGDDLFILVQPSEKCRYENLIDAMDEIMITGVKKWMFLDIPKAEYDHLLSVSGAIK